MSNHDQSDLSGELSPKQRLELERWARLNDMTVEEFLRSNVHEQLRLFRSKRMRALSDEDEGDALQSQALA